MRTTTFDPANPAHRAAFRDLNLAWIEKHFVVEERDRLELNDPESRILSHGGQIFLVEDGDDVLGVCAAILEPNGACELAKMAVAESARGRGIGRMLGKAVIAHARSHDAPYVELVSNTDLTPAIGLYRALGFIEVPMPESSDYKRSNIRMVLDLTPASTQPPAPPGAPATQG